MPREEGAVRKGRLGLDYRQLSIGSFLGLFTGFVIGKLSRVFVFFAGSAYLLIQFLVSRGVITIPYTQLYGWAKNKLGDRDYMLENTSFKVAFASAMIVAASNA
ncbi:uncharacterized protein V1510DRAFT_418380 [Dipodascopsis tothii]|uniref:uncharacterized protein n=1 Tax=Dipodascopsis tothii TaxID=44089 RepID=UPI0034CDC0B7